MIISPSVLSLKHLKLIIMCALEIVHATWPHQSSYYTALSRCTSPLNISSKFVYFNGLEVDR